MPSVMNIETGKISKQLHVILENKFETVVLEHSEESIGAGWKSIFCLGGECFEDVDYDNNGNAILPSLTSLLQQDDIANEIAPTSP